jgi:uncharacterized membrane protein required for colicin V production
MLDVIVGIAIACFVILGIREGIAKSLGSIALVFVSLFLATATIDFLAKGASQFKDPSYLGTIIIFFLVWLLSYIILDLVLMLLFRRIIKIIILGPMDMVGGLLIGGFKGTLICGVILSLVLAMPISAASKKYISGSRLASLSIAVYQWAYPHAKRIAPKIGNLMKIDIVEEMNKGNEIKVDAELSPDKLMGEVSEAQKVLTGQEEHIRKLIKEQKLLRNVPQSKVEK